MSRKVQPLIFIVDSNVAYRNNVAKFLNDNGFYNLQSFNCGEECYVLSEGLGADFIIVDHKMDKDCWNGLEFMHEYKNSYTDSKFIFLFFVTGIELAVECIKCGALDYILKSKLGLNRLLDYLEEFCEYFKQRHVALHVKANS